MSRQVIIEVPDVAAERVRWVAVDGKGGLLSDIEEGSFEEAAQAVQGRRVTMVLPGETVLLAEATVPGGSTARAQQAVPYALEDQVADDVERLHFAIGARGEGDRYPVAVIDRDTMDALVERCAETGLQPAEVVSGVLALPTPEPPADGRVGWIALVDGDTAMVRLHGAAGFSTDADLVGLMLEGARADLDAEVTPHLVLYRTRGAGEFTIESDLDIDHRDCESRLALYAQALRGAVPINLLQGEYSQKRRFDEAWRPWRATAALLAVIAVVLFGQRALEAVTLAREEAALDTAIETVFREALPNARLQRPEFQMRQRLAEITGGDTDGFTSRLSQIAGSLATQGQTEVRSISFRDGRFDLDLTTDELPTLDALEQALAERGDLEMTVQSANRDGDGLRGRVRVE